VQPDFDKQSQRLEFRHKRDQFVEALSSQDRALAFSTVPSALAQYLLPSKIVAGYIAIGSEVNPAALLTQAYKMGCAIALPLKPPRAPGQGGRWQG
jgi:5-formyltetrahydrofolate cyclo-ligase